MLPVLVASLRIQSSTSDRVAQSTATDSQIDGVCVTGSCYYHLPRSFLYLNFTPIKTVQVADPLGEARCAIHFTVTFVLLESSGSKLLSPL